MMRKHKESDQENYYKDAFRVFFKDESGCVPAEELKFIFRSLNVNCLKYFSTHDNELFRLQQLKWMR